MNRRIGGWRRAFLAAACLAVAGGARAATNYVAKWGNDTTGSGTAASPWATIGKAMTMISSGDSIFVGGGVYTQSVSFTGKSRVRLRGGYDGAWAWTPATQRTEVFGNGSSPIVLPATGLSNTLSYLTLRGGTTANKAGIEVTGAAKRFYVEGCTIVSNYYGVYVGNYSPLSVEMRNTLVARNTSDGVGFYYGSIGSSPGGTGFVYNCTISDNGGHGFRCGNGNPDHGDLVPRAYNTILTRNAGYGIYKRGISTGGIVSNCLFYANRSGAIGAHAALAMGGNKTREPRFVNPSAVNYQLQANSPAAAAGLSLSGRGVTNDIVGAARPNGAWDMGAYEGSGAGEGALVSAAYVATPADGGNDTTGNGSSGSPWATVHYALGQVTNGGTVRVASGTYAEQVGFGPDKRFITIQGGFAPGTWVWDPSNRVTAINGGGYSPIQLSPGANSNVLRCLTLRGGTGTDEAGVEFSGSAPYLKVASCTITGNYHGVYAGYCIPVAPTLINTVIARNTQRGIYYYLRQNSGTVLSTKIYNSTIAYNGNDGFFCDVNVDWSMELVPVAKNSLFCFNGGNGLYKRGGGAGASIQNCFFYGNTVGDTLGTGYSLLANLGGNKSGRDPKFVNAAANNFRLQASSPAAAAGMDLSGASYGVTNDITGATRPQGAWDMGAYESAGAGETALTNLLHVSTAGSDATGSGSAANPYATIGYALGRVATGGTVRVAGGVYPENIRFGPEKAGITVQGGYTNSGGIWSLDVSHQLTRINGNGNPPVTVETGADNNRVANLSLVRGNNTSQAGIAMNGQAPRLLVDGCTIVSNYYGLYSGPMMRQVVTVRNSIVARSTSHGIHFCLKDSGGFTSVGTNFLYNCTIANNGGHGFFTEGNNEWRFITPIARNCLFTGNAGYGICKRGSSAGGVIDYCLFYNNTSGDYSALNGAFATVAHVTAGMLPKYVNEAANDYRLEADSPAVDTGTNLTALGVTTDIQGAARPLGTKYDMGAYERAGSGGVVLRTNAYVRLTGSDTTGNGSATNPWRTVSFALGRTVSSGTVFVAGGTYTGTVALSVNKSRAAVRGGYDPATWAWDPANQATVIDGRGQPPVTVAGGSESNLLSYLTLKGGASGGQAGIRFDGVAPHLFVEGCTIVSNLYGTYTGFGLGQTLTLKNTIIAHNTSHGVYNDLGNSGSALKGYVYLYNCTVADNGGTGVAASGNQEHGDMLTVAINTIFANNGGYGVVKRGCSAGGQLVNCLFYRNASGATYEFGQLPLSLLRDNKSGRDPMFVNAAACDYRLQASSPAAAAGTNIAALGVTTDIRNVGRPQGGVWDMGAHEGSGGGEAARPASAYVATTGSDTTGDGTQGNPWRTVAKAVAHTAAGGRVRVAAGTYAENVFLDMEQDKLTIEGGYSAGWSFRPSTERTTLNGGGGSPITITAGANSNVLSQLTLTGGTGGNRAGIEFIGEAPYATVDGCRLTGNVYGMRGEPGKRQYVTMRNAIVSGNSQHGVYFYNDWATYVRVSIGVCYLYNCTLANNGLSGVYSGCGVSDRDYITPVAKNALFTGNGGWGLFKSRIGDAGDLSSIASCLFFGNASGTYQSDIDDLGGTIAGSDPLYEAAGPDYYRIQRDSPAFDSGANLASLGVTQDILGMPRPRGSLYDRGAYELFVPPSGTLFVIR